MHISGLLVVLACSSSAHFDAVFTGKTLRFDYYHSGTDTAEEIGLDEVRLEGDWPGSRTHLLDATNLGKYLFVVTDVATNLTLYSRGFASIYGEWETTGEAGKKIWRTFHESQRFPEPKQKCQLSLKKRATDGSFREIYSVVVDPESRFVNRSRSSAEGEVWSVFKNGPSAKKVDLLVLGDGYAKEEMRKFRSDVRRLVGALFDSEPFSSHRGEFNVWAIDTASARGGIPNPRKGLWNDTPLGLRFNAFDLDRYVLTYKNRALREVAALAPYDTLVILGNTDKYGGGGIFNLWATCASDTSEAAYIFVHELGHSFAGLADEYYSSQVAYDDFTPPGMEPWEPNITAFLDSDRLKWRDLVEATTPAPTPWNQEAYDKASQEYQRKRRKLREEGAAESKLEGLFKEIKERTRALFAKERFKGRVGVFEGAGYQAKGLYRSEVDCIMFTRNPKSFCRVCSRAIERVIKLYVE